MRQDTTARLLIMCPDQPGIVAAVSNFFYHHGANITALDQHSTDPEGGKFFMRLEFQTPHLNVTCGVLSQAFAQTIAKRYHMQWQLSAATKLKKVALLVSKHDHALLELLWRFSRGELLADITQVISNHQDLEEAVRSFNIPYHYIPVTAQTKKEAEAQLLAVLGEDTDLLVLARYMQILSGDVVAHFPNKIINIHHSFLPAFVGANPYQQAYDEGVKLIGATAHYITKKLDVGPIIEQSVVRVTHRDDVDDLKEKGRDIEKNVLARAVKWHLEDRILIDGNKTVVFNT